MLINELWDDMPTASRIAPCPWPNKVRLSNAHIHATSLPDSNPSTDFCCCFSIIPSTSIMRSQHIPKYTVDTATSIKQVIRTSLALNTGRSRTMAINVTVAASVVEIRLDLEPVNRINVKTHASRTTYAISLASSRFTYEE